MIEGDAEGSVFGRDLFDPPGVWAPRGFDQQPQTAEPVRDQRFLPSGAPRVWAPRGFDQQPQTAEPGIMLTCRKLTVMLALGPLAIRDPPTRDGE